METQVDSQIVSATRTFEWTAPGQTQPPAEDQQTDAAIRTERWKWGLIFTVVRRKRDEGLSSEQGFSTGVSVRISVRSLWQEPSQGSPAVGSLGGPLWGTGLRR